MNLDRMMKKDKRITINDIATLAGVSKATVSEVINNNPKQRVNQKTFERVSRIIEECHYTPLPQARALSTSRTRQLGYLVSSSATLGLANSYYSLILAGIEAACAAADYRCSISRYDLTSVTQFVMPPGLRQRNVDALIIAGMLGSTGSTLSSLGIPIAVLGNCDDRNLFRLDSDFVSSCGAIFAYLADQGHRKLLLPYSCPERRRELEAALALCNRSRREALEAVFTAHYVEGDEFTRGASLGEMALFHPAFADCTALVANDQICAGFMQTFHRHHRHFPEDYSVVAGSDTELTQWGMTPITALRSRNFETGELAARLLIELLEDRLTAAEVEAAFRADFVPDVLQIRASSGPVPHKPVNPQ